MKTLVLEFLSNFWILLSSISVYILIGVLVAGVFKLLLPDAVVKKHLGSHNFIANIKAAILGIPLPLCSRSVRPFVSALKKSGASKSAIQTFLISTPITGADSIMATYGVFGWLFTLYRVITSVVISLIAGFFTLFFDRDDKIDADKEAIKTTAKANKTLTEPLSEAGQSFKPVSQSAYKVINSPLNINVGANAALLNIGVVKEEDKKNIFQRVLAYSFDDILKDISRSLLIGILIGAVIVTFMPENLAEYISANIFLNYLLVLSVSVPLYVCATSSIPLGLSLLSAGFSPGAAFIFLTAGPATNTVTISVVQKTLGKRSLIIYLLSVILGSLLFGTLFDYIFPHSLEKMLIFPLEETPGFIAQISSVILLYLTLKYTFSKNSQVIQKGGCGGSNGSCCGTN
jgi:uncharacterized membrane protein YraQ (UPF0718 family)